MDLNAVKLFVQAAEAGSISEAARRTGIPLPTLSRQLRKLEDDLGMRLLDRGPRGLALTPAGTQLVSDAQPALRFPGAGGAPASRRLGSGRSAAHLHAAAPRGAVGDLPRLPSSVPSGDLRCVHLRQTRRPGRRRDRRRAPRRRARHRRLRRTHADPLSPSTRRLTEVPRRSSTQGAARSDPRPLRLLAQSGRERLAPWRHDGGARARARHERLPSPGPARRGRRCRHRGTPFLAARGLEQGRLVEPLPAHPLPEHPMRALVVERRSMSPLVRQFLDYASEHVAQALGTLA